MRALRTTLAIVLVLWATLATLAARQSPPAPKSSLDRVRAGGLLRLGYRVDARPLSFRDENGRAAGYSVMLCQSIVDAIRREPGLGATAVDWVPVTTEDRFTAIEQGRADIICGASTVTLERRERVAFSIPIFIGGIGAVVRADAPEDLRVVLAGQAQTLDPIWHASAKEPLKARTFAAVAGTTADTWLTSRIRELNLTSDVTRAGGYEAGVQAVADKKVDALFGERAILLDAVHRSPSSNELSFLDRFFTYEPLAFALARGDEDLRLAVDRTLSRLYTSGGIRPVYAAWFGEPDQATLNFLNLVAIPQ